MPKIFLIKNRLHQQQLRLLESQNLLQNKDDDRLVPPLSPTPPPHNNQPQGSASSSKSQLQRNEENDSQRPQSALSVNEPLSLVSSRKRSNHNQHQYLNNNLHQLQRAYDDEQEHEVFYGNRNCSTDRLAKPPSPSSTESDYSSTQASSEAKIISRKIALPLPASPQNSETSSSIGAESSNTKGRGVTRFRLLSNSPEAVIRPDLPKSPVTPPSVEPAQPQPRRFISSILGGDIPYDGVPASVIPESSKTLNRNIAAPIQVLTQAQRKEYPVELVKSLQLQRASCQSPAESLLDSDSDSDGSKLIVDEKPLVPEDKPLSLRTTSSPPPAETRPSPPPPPEPAVRCSVIQRTPKPDSAHCGRNLVTSDQHDIRLPLTSLAHLGPEQEQPIDYHVPRRRSEFDSDDDSKLEATGGSSSSKRVERERRLREARRRSAILAARAVLAQAHSLNPRLARHLPGILVAAAGHGRSSGGQSQGSGNCGSGSLHFSANSGGSASGNAGSNGSSQLGSGAAGSGTTPGFGSTSGGGGGGGMGGGRDGRSNYGPNSPPTGSLPPFYESLKGGNNMNSFNAANSNFLIQNAAAYLMSGGSSGGGGGIGGGNSLNDCSSSTLAGELPSGTNVITAYVNGQGNNNCPSSVNSAHCHTNSNSNSKYQMFNHAAYGIILKDEPDIDYDDTKIDINTFTQSMNAAVAAAAATNAALNGNHNTYSTASYEDSVMAEIAAGGAGNNAHGNSGQQGVDPLQFTATLTFSSQNDGNILDHLSDAVDLSSFLQRLPTEDDDSPSPVQDIELGSTPSLTPDSITPVDSSCLDSFHENLMQQITSNISRNHIGPSNGNGNSNANCFIDNRFHSQQQQQHQQQQQQQHHHHHQHHHIHQQQNHSQNAPPPSYQQTREMLQIQHQNQQSNQQQQQHHHNNHHHHHPHQQQHQLNHQQQQHLSHHSYNNHAHQPSAHHPHVGHPHPTSLIVPHPQLLSNGSPAVVGGGGSSHHNSNGYGLHNPHGSGATATHHSLSQLHHSSDNSNLSLPSPASSNGGSGAAGINGHHHHHHLSSATNSSSSTSGGGGSGGIGNGPVGIGALLENAAIGDTKPLIQSVSPIYSHTSLSSSLSPIVQQQKQDECYKTNGSSRHSSSASSLRSATAAAVSTVLTQSPTVAMLNERKLLQQRLGLPAEVQLEFVNGGHGIKNPLAIENSHGGSGHHHRIRNSIDCDESSKKSSSSSSIGGGNGNGASASIISLGVVSTSDEDPSKFVCRVCLKSFTLQRLLNRHMKCHSEIKRYLCTFCGKGFNDTFDLKRHTRTHTGVRPYKCNLCEKSFTQRCSLESHCLKVHSVQHQYAYKERRAKMYVCEECGHTTCEPEVHYLHLKDNHPFSPALLKFYDKRHFKFTNSQFANDLLGQLPMPVQN